MIRPLRALLVAALVALAPVAASAGSLTGVTVGADRTSSTANPLFCVGGGNPNACLSPLGSYPAAGGPFVHQGDGSQLNLTVGGVTKNFPAWWATIGQPNGPASLNASGQLPSAQIPFGTTSGTVASGAVDPIARSAVQPGAPVDTNTALGRTFSARLGDVINVMDAAYGAKGDGSTDDTAAINLASAAFRAALTAGRPARLVFAPGHQFKVATSGGLNLTGYKSYLGTIEVDGAQILCATSGTICVDATGTDHVHWRGLKITGLGGATESSIGLQTARTSNTTDCGQQNFADLNIDGAFTKAAYLNVACETNHYTAASIRNSDTGASRAYIADGQNHSSAQSAYQTITQTVDATNSFDEDTWEAPTFTSSGTLPPVQLIATTKHRFIGGYLLNQGTGTADVELYDSGNPNTLLDWDVHMEGTVANGFLQTGTNATPTILGFRYHDQQAQLSNSYFKLDTGVTSATMMAADVEIVQPTSNAIKLFDAPSAWTVTGKLIYPTALTSVVPGTFSGFSCAGINCLNTLVLPSTIQASSVVNTGGIAPISLTTGIFPTANIVATPTSSGLPLPAIVIGAPPSGGQQAAAHVATMQLAVNPGIQTPGSGYTAGDQVTASNWTCASPAKFNINAVSSGVPTNVTVSGDPHCSVAYNTATTSGGTGAGLVLSFGSNAFRVGWSSTESASGTKDIVLDSPGAGYTSAPPVTIGGSSSVGVTLNSVLTLGAGTGQVLMNAAGTNLGVNGASGSPAISQGALIDASGVRVALSGNYTVPANTSLVRFTQTSSVTSTVTLPAALADGQPVQFVNEAAGAVTLTFSPAVGGWTQGSTLAAGPGVGLRVRWDASAAAWFREQ